MDDERLYTRLEECQNRRKMGLILQYGVPQAVLMKILVFFAVSHFQAYLTVYVFSTVVSVLVAIFTTAEMHL